MGSRQWWEEDEEQEFAEVGDHQLSFRDQSVEGGDDSSADPDAARRRPTGTGGATEGRSNTSGVSKKQAEEEQELHKRKEYPTAEHAVRTLALHTGLGYILGMGVGLVGKVQSLIRVGRMTAHESMHYVDPFAVAAEFARPLFLVACLEVGSMYATPAIHNLRLPRTPLSTTSTTPSSGSREARKESEGGDEWGASQSEDGEYGLDQQEKNEVQSEARHGSLASEWDDLSSRKEVYLGTDEYQDEELSK